MLARCLAGWDQQRKKPAVRLWDTLTAGPDIWVNVGHSRSSAAISAETNGGVLMKAAFLVPSGMTPGICCRKQYAPAEAFMGCRGWRWWRFFHRTLLVGR